MRPYARALHAIENSPAEVVLIDDAGIFEANVLPANDPYLRDGPKVMVLRLIEPADLQRLCATRSIALFDREVAGPLGMRLHPGKPPAAGLRNRALMRQWGCGETRVSPNVS
jgi:hypothetical protein